MEVLPLKQRLSPTPAASVSSFMVDREDREEACYLSAGVLCIYTRIQIDTHTPTDTGGCVSHGRMSKLFLWSRNRR